MASRNTPPDRLGGVLPAVLQRVDPDRQLKAYAVWNWWDEEVGDTIARRAQPARFRNGILFVTVANHTWMQELQFMKETIREKLNVRLEATDPPLIRDIFFVSGPITKPPPAPVPGTPEPEPEKPPPTLLPAVGDKRLDALFARIMHARARHERRGK
jgi:hypothetical protein